MSENARSAGRAGLFWTLLPHLVFAVLFVATFRRWMLPFEDSGREMNTALRLANGETLYRDVGYSYGPLPPVLDGLLLRTFGRSLDVLIAWRTVLALLGVEALRRLARRLASGESLPAAVSAFAVAACAFGVGGSWPFPYSVAALSGTVGAWWALELALASESRAGSIAAGIVAGLAAGTKLEMVPLALLGPFIVLVLRRPRKEAFAAGAGMLGTAAAAYAVPIIRFGGNLMKRQGFLIALSVPEPWRRVYESVFFGGLTRADFARGGFRDVLFPSAVGIALALLLREGGKTANAVLLPLLFVAGSLTFLSPGNAWLHGLLPLAACVAVGGLVRAAIEWRREGSLPEPAAAGAAFVMLAALVRQPFFLRNPVYGAFSAPLALVVAICWIGRHTHVRNAFAALVLGLSAAQVALRVQGIGMATMAWTSLPGASLYLVPAESRFVTEAARVIRETVPEGGNIGIFPEPGFLLFVTGRKNPFVDELFLPGVQDAQAEDLMIRRLLERPPAAILVTNRAYPEFGQATYGHGLLDRFFLEVSRRYVPARSIGGKAGEVPLRHASGGLLFVPRSGRSP